jgi:hypothetical protein
VLFDRHFCGDHPVVLFAECWHIVAAMLPNAHSETGFIQARSPDAASLRLISDAIISIAMR